MRIIHHYGARPEFVLLGGLVPELLCAGSEFQHAGTIDVDVQVDLEIAYGAVNAARLEQALHNAEFVPEDGRTWRWVADGEVAGTVVKFELLADLHDQRTGARISFDACENLGALNLHGTGFASRDIQVRDLGARIGGVAYNTQVNVAGLSGFLLAKAAAAYSRRTPKDWYDIAFVLLHNDAGGPAAPTDRDLRQSCRDRRLAPQQTQAGAAVGYSGRTDHSGRRMSGDSRVRRATRITRSGYRERNARHSRNGIFCSRRCIGQRDINTT